MSSRDTWRNLVGRSCAAAGYADQSACAHGGDCAAAIGRPSPSTAAAGRKSDTRVNSSMEAKASAASPCARAYGSLEDLSAHAELSRVTCGTLAAAQSCAKRTAAPSSVAATSPPLVQPPRAPSAQKATSTPASAEASTPQSGLSKSALRWRSFELAADRPSKARGSARPTEKTSPHSGDSSSWRVSCSPVRPVAPATTLR
mmetsp:Transcript_23659/g.63326  ORF Transcript_23659/g.63326 Transcript_23659/m.63326 type:complete len:201 (+) Transcript_23659:125-727(+)